MDIKVNKNTVIVFDLDDTLYNELDFLKSAYQFIAKQLQPKYWEPLYASMFSLYRNKENVFEILSSKHNIEKQLLIEMYRNHVPNINLFEGALEIIEATKVKEGKIGIITDGRSKTQMAKIKSLGIEDLIGKIVISEDLGTEKPNPNNFKAIETHFPNSTYWYIADNLKKDFVAPNALSWKSVCLLDNGKNIHYQSYKYMDKEYQPKAFIQSYKEVNII
ncbi:HAD family hydrolase [uncultured Winogradskyella sp.]|uniref:HAD family hydrolase n=1 Tax=uncultured Winogradskyella sp. TaxID=395353 RepID=UPI0026039E0F|nr:HAD family hydrolase [uncultured Winogradskyella sp.]